MNDMKYAALISAALMTASVFDVYALYNPSFEEIKDATAAGWNLTKGCFRAEKGAGLSGSGGVVWESAEPSKVQGMCGCAIEAEAGVAYRFSCFVHAENFIPGPGGSANICVEWFDAKGKWMAGGYSKDFAERNSEWIEIGGCTREIPVKAKKVRLSLYVKKGAKGRVSFDNVMVRPIRHDVVAFVFSSVYRDMAADGEVRFHASLHPDKNVKVGDLDTEFSYVGADGSRKRVKPSALYPDGASLVLRVEDLALGTNPVACSLRGKDGGLLGSASCEFTRVRRLPDRRVWIDSRQRCIVDGKPFFPLGMYWMKVDAKKLENNIVSANKGLMLNAGISGAILILGFIFNRVKLYISGGVLMMLSSVYQAFYFMHNLTDSGGVVGLSPKFYWRHLIPLALIAISIVWITVIAVRAKIKLKKQYKKVTENLFTMFNVELTDGEFLSDEQWDEFLKVYDPAVNYKKQFATTKNTDED
jgi:hypothetical protein